MFWILSLIIGAGVGSFVNVLAARVVAGQSIILPRSFCDSCAKPLFRRDMIPIFSALLLKFKCRFCKQKFSWQHPIVEAITAILFTAAYFQVGDFSWQLIFMWFAIMFLIALFLTDIRAMLLPDHITLPAIAIILLIDVLFLDVDVKALGLAVLLGGGFFLVQYVVSKGRWIGSGDIRLGALMGVILPTWQTTLLALAIAYIFGAIIGVYLLISKKQTLESEIAFGTFLVIGTLMVLFCQNYFILI